MVVAPGAAESLVHALGERIPAGESGQPVAAGAGSSTIRFLVQLEALAGGADHGLDPKREQFARIGGFRKVRGAELDRPLDRCDIGRCGNQEYGRSRLSAPLVLLNPGAGLQGSLLRRRRIDDHGGRTHLVEGLGERAACTEGSKTALGERGLQHLYQLRARTPDQDPGRRPLFGIGRHGPR
jgi:hypothetical protein